MNGVSMTTRVTDTSFTAVDGRWRRRRRWALACFAGLLRFVME